MKVFNLSTSDESFLNVNTYDDIKAIKTVYSHKSQYNGITYSTYTLELCCKV